MKKMENRKNNFKKIVFLFSITFIFLFFFLSLVSGERLETAQFTEASGEFGSYFSNYPSNYRFNSGGTIAYFLTRDPSGVDRIFQFPVTNPFNVSSIQFTFNQTFSPQLNFTGESQQAEGFHVINGTDVYVGYIGASTFNSKIRHFKTSPNNISNMTLISSENYTAGTTSINDLWVSEDGTRLIAWNWIDNSVGHAIYSYRLSTPYVLSSISSMGDSFATNGGSGTLGDIFVTSSGFKVYTIDLNSIAGTTSIKEYNFTSAYNSSTLFEVGSLTGTCANCFFRGITATETGFNFHEVDNTFTLDYLLQYRFNSSASSSESSQTPTGLVDFITNIFPDEATLTTKQKMSYVFTTIILTAILVAFLVYALTRKGNSPPVGIVLSIFLLLLIVEFVYFVAIGYISIGILIFLVVIALALILLRLRS